MLSLISLLGMVTSLEEAAAEAYASSVATSGDSLDISFSCIAIGCSMIAVACICVCIILSKSLVGGATPGTRHCL